MLQNFQKLNHILNPAGIFLWWRWDTVSWSTKYDRRRYDDNALWIDYHRIGQLSTQSTTLQNSSYHFLSSFVNHSGNNKCFQPFFHNATLAILVVSYSVNPLFLILFMRLFTLKKRAYHKGEDMWAVTKRKRRDQTIQTMYVDGGDQRSFCRFLYLSIRSFDDSWQDINWNILNIANSRSIPSFSRLSSSGVSINPLCLSQTVIFDLYPSL